MNLPISFTDFEKIINAIIDAEEKSKRINAILSDLNSENQVFSIIPDEYQESYRLMLKKIIGDGAFGWVEWWLWDVGPDRKGVCYLPSGDVCQIASIDQLYDYLKTYEWN